MTEVSTQAAQATPKKPSTSTKISKKVIPKMSHPRTSEMVTEAISNLKERGGSSLQAIKKYIAGAYMLDADKQAHFIKKYLKSAVMQGEIIQTKGKGASGSFKLGSATAKPKAPVKSKTAAEKPDATKKSKTTKVDVAKKIAVAKKSPVKKTAANKKTVKDATKKSPSKKTAKSPTKPKAPKPKKAVTKKSVKTATK